MVAVAGCSLGAPGSDGDLVVGTYGAFLDAPSISPGEWLKSEFESEFDAELSYQSPDAGVGQYVEQKRETGSVDADLYLGVNTDELVNADDELDESLFESDLEIEGQENIRSGLSFDPMNRAIPFNTGYISLVYDSTAVEAPETFDGLLEDEYEGALIGQDARSTTGLAFLLHTIHYYGEDEYLDYWEQLQANNVQLFGEWADAYGAWSEGEAPMVVSYSTDQVYAAQEGANLQEHQIRFLNDQAYANPEGMAIFSDASDPELARDFLEFILRPEIQGEIAQRNVVFPATENAELPSLYSSLAKEPAEPVTFSYDELQGSLDGWLTEWERQIVGN